MYDTPIDERIARVKSLLTARDYEGVTTLSTADLFEITAYAELARKLVGYLNRTDESESGKVFKPVSMTCCRALWMDDLSKTLKKLGVE